jgi:pyrimidine operon attenuation protein/uracil phosphoribosyltransferase
LTQLLDARAVADAVDAVAERLQADMRLVERWALVGIRSGGTPLADRLARKLVGAGLAPLRGDLDITLYRDDLYTGAERPVLGDTDLPFEVSGCGIVLVDDVLFTGRTVRAALGEIVDFGRPAFVRLCVLVDRGHRELPIQPDYVGARVSTSRSDRVFVDWEESRVELR